MGQWLRTLAVLSRELGSSPRTNMAIHSLSDYLEWQWKWALWVLWLIAFLKLFSRMGNSK